MSTTKTYVACRPGFLQQAKAAFSNLEVEVDNDLTQDYEFRQRDKSMAELLDDEVQKTERLQADPKDAMTVVVPMALSAAEVQDNCLSATYLAVRLEQRGTLAGVWDVIHKTSPEIGGTFPDFEVDVSATIGKLNAALKAEGYNVLSISSADLVLLAD